MYKNSFSFLLFFFGIVLAFSQAKTDTITLKEVMLQGSPIKSTVQNAACAVSVITTTEINKTDGTILTPVLNKIPGVLMQQGSLNTTRITIRGIGARSQYGTSRIKAYFNSIPLSSGEGETVIEDIDVLAIEKIEIIKGPNSTSFGSGLGGVIHLLAKETPSLESFGKATTTIGSYGLLQQRLSGGYSDVNTALYTSYLDLQSEGYRANSAYQRKSFNLNGSQKISSKGNISFLGVFTRLKVYIPSSLNEKDFINNPEVAAPTWAASQGYESYDKLLLGLGYDHQFAEKWALKSNVFSTFKKGYEARPFDILEDKTNSLGLRLHLNYKDFLLTLPFEISVGTELAAENYEYFLFKNLYLSKPGQGSVQGDKFSGIEQKRNYINYFIQAEVLLIENLHFETGVAFNTTRYSIKDVFRTNAINQDKADSFGAIWSPRIGFSYKVGDNKNIYTSVSKGFSVPSVAESLTPGGQINTELKPEIGLNYELGFKGNWFSDKVYTELAFFSTQIENLLVARRTADDQYVGINAGSSSHPGMEFMINYKLLNSGGFQISPYLSAAINNFKFKDFVDRNVDYSGNKLTGVPDKQWNLGLDFYTKEGFSVNLSYLTVGKIPMNDSNTKYSDAYSLLDIKATYLFTILKVLKTELNAGINNALNEKYAASILPNAVGFGASQPRYYYPGNPINYYGGFSVSYVF